MLGRSLAAVAALTAISFLAVPVAGATRKAPAGPRAIVNEIYTHEITFLAVDRHEWFSRDLVALWEKADAGTQEGELGAIDFDLASNSNGMEVGSFKVKTVHAGGSHVTLEVTLVSRGVFHRGAPSDNVVRYKFVREGGRWLIDDMSSTADGSPWTLRGLLGQATH